MNEATQKCVQVSTFYRQDATPLVITRLSSRRRIALKGSRPELAVKNRNQIVQIK